MHLSIPYTKTSSAEEAYNIACDHITSEYIAKWNVKADVKYDEAAKCISAKGKGFTLTLTFTDSETNVDLNLGFLLKAFKGTILEKVEHKLSKHL